MAPDGNRIAAFGLSALIELQDGGSDSRGIQALVSHLLPEPAASFEMRSEMVVLAFETVLQQKAAEPAAQPGLHIPAFDHQHKRRLRNHLHHRFINDIERGLVDQANIHASIAQTYHCVESAVYRFSNRDDISAPHLRRPDDIVFTGLKRFALVKRLAVLRE